MISGVGRIVFGVEIVGVRQIVCGWESGGVRRGVFGVWIVMKSWIMTTFSCAFRCRINLTSRSTRFDLILQLILLSSCLSLIRFMATSVLRKLSHTDVILPYAPRPMIFKLEYRSSTWNISTPTASLLFDLFIFEFMNEVSVALYPKKVGAVFNRRSIIYRINR